MRDASLYIRNVELSLYQTCQVCTSTGNQPGTWQQLLACAMRVLHEDSAAPGHVVQHAEGGGA